MTQPSPPADLQHYLMAEIAKINHNISQQKKWNEGFVQFYEQTTKKCKKIDQIQQQIQLIQVHSNQNGRAIQKLHPLNSIVKDLSIRLRYFEESKVNSVYRYTQSRDNTDSRTGGQDIPTARLSEIEQRLSKLEIEIKQYKEDFANQEVQIFPRNQLPIKTNKWDQIVENKFLQNYARKEAVQDNQDHYCLQNPYQQLIKTRMKEPVENSELHKQYQFKVNRKTEGQDQGWKYYTERYTEKKPKQKNKNSKKKKASLSSNEELTPYLLPKIELKSAHKTKKSKTKSKSKSKPKSLKGKSLSLRSVNEYLKLRAFFD